MTTAPAPMISSSAPAVVVAALATARALAHKWIEPVLALGLRLWMAQVFFSSGLTKIASWENTVFLFEFEYQVPVLPPVLAAGFATAFELAMPVLLVAGYTYPACRPATTGHGARYPVRARCMPTPPSRDIAHYYWMIRLIVIAVRGPGAALARPLRVAQDQRTSARPWPRRA